MNQPSDPSLSPPPRKRASGWWAVAMLVLTFACLSIPILLIRAAMQKARQLDPVGAVKDAVAASARSIAEAFRTGTVETTFRSYATEVKGVSKLQFAELKQSESFERKDSASIAFGTIPLPDVVVEARGQVVYTYTLDLQKRWDLKLSEQTVDVLAPAPEFNPPALDPSSLKIETKQGSVLRDEASVKEALRTGLTDLLNARARAHIPLVRETGRKATEDFVRTFLLSHYDDASRFTVRVRFADETVAVPPTPLSIEGAPKR